MTKDQQSTEPKQTETKKPEVKELSPAEALAEMKDLLQRTQANFENYRKQTERRVEEMQQFIVQNTMLKILPLVDNFTLSLKHTSNPEEFKQGMELIYAQLLALLENNGVKPMETEKQKFDPYFHEALIKVDSEQPEGIILEEFQRGFMINGKVLRHAKVKISSGRKPQVEECKEKVQTQENNVNNKKNNLNGGK